MSDLTEITVYNGETDPLEDNSERARGRLYLWPGDIPERRLLGCPRCGRYSSPSRHQLTRHDDGTVSLWASVLTPCCGAHFYVTHNTITWTN